MQPHSVPTAAAILTLHDAANTRWHLAATPEPASATPLLGLIATQHRANFDLWHEEDEARDPAATDAHIARVKHAIDAINQRRNDLVETLDSLIHEEIAQTAAAPLHSETPGMMIDRLSILALKIFHTREESERASATQAHREKSSARLAVLTQQRADLATCLDLLFADLAAGLRCFKIYRQMKMYNDPDLNPVLYRQLENDTKSTEG